MRLHTSLYTLSMGTLAALAIAGCGTDIPDDPDPPCSETYYADMDGDGFGDDAASMDGCEAPVGFVATAGDCNDDDPAVNPDAPEICDAIDNNCNGLLDIEDPEVDLSTATTYYPDTDGDGHGDANGTPVEGCEAPSDHVTNDTDCNDSDTAINPEAIEVCDAVDNDCDTLIDDDDDDVDLTGADSFYPDMDDDGYGAGNPIVACQRPPLHSTDDGDCNDNAAAVSPDAIEVCDGIDNDCDNLTDDDDDDVDLTDADSFYLDLDGDGFGVGAPVVACTQPPQHAPVDGDCNDSTDAAFPGATEICDDLDNDCDGGVDGTPMNPNQCSGFIGSYAGTYGLVAREMLGQVVINEMFCQGGTTSFTIDLAQSPALQGTVTCTRVGSGSLFNLTQGGSITADVLPDGTFTGRIVHTFNNFATRVYSFTGALTSGMTSVSGTGTVLPHPMSAVPWQVTYDFDAATN